MDKEGLRISAQRANKEGYGSGKEQNWEKEADGSTVITLTFGDFEVRDKFWGGEPFGGCEVISFQGKPVWMMVYYGSVARGQDSERIYATL